MSRITYFRWSLLTSLITFFCLLPCSAFTSFFIPGVWRKGIGIQSITIIVLINAVFAVVLFFWGEIAVSPQGIRCTNSWGKLRFAEWSTISSAKYYSGCKTLGIRYLLVSSTKYPDEIWLPLLFDNMPQFRQLISSYAGNRNPITRCISEQNTSAYSLRESEDKIKWAWQSGIIHGSLGLLFVLLEVSGYEISDSIDAWSILDVGLVFGLTYGIYKKSRAAAVTMLVYSLFNLFFVIVELKRIPGLLSWFLLLLYTGGVQATFTYRKLSERPSK